MQRSLSTGVSGISPRFGNNRRISLLCLQQFGFLRFRPSIFRVYGGAVVKPRIGLVSDYFRTGVAEGAAAYGRTHGVDIDPRWSVRGDWMSEQPEWDGVIAEVVNMPVLEERLVALKLPMVLLAPITKEAAYLSRVWVDYRACGALACEELVSTGVRSLVVLCSSTREIDQESAAGFINAALLKGRKVIDPEPVRKAAGANLPLPELVRLYADALQEVERPAGVFHAHAGAFYSLSIELMARGFRIPEDFSVVVIQKDVQGTAEMAPVPLTTVDPDNWQQGYFAAKVLHRHLKGEPTDTLLHRIPPLGLTRRDSTGVPVAKDPAVAKVLHLIRDRFATDLKVDELAHLAGVGRRSLEERFRKEMRMTLHECLMKRRTEEAKKLLRATPMSVSLIAEACGYTSVHYFSTAFKRAAGTSPAAYRKNAGGGKSD